MHARFCFSANPVISYLIGFLFLQGKNICRVTWLKKP